MRTAILSSILGLLLPFCAIAQIEVPYSTLQWINPEEELQPMEDGYNGHNNKLGNFNFLGDSSFVVSAAVYSPENGVDWFKIYHNAYDLNLQLKSAVLAGKSAINQMNSQATKFKTTKNYFVDINNYCVGDQSYCALDSSILISAIYDKNLNMVDTDTIASNLEISLTNYYSNSDNVSVRTFSTHPTQNYKPIVWFEESSLTQGTLDPSEVSSLPLNSKYIGGQSTAFYFLTEEILGSSLVYNFVLYQNGQPLKRFAIDTMITGVTGNVQFKENSDGSYILSARQSGRFQIIKINSSFELMWKQEIAKPEQVSLRPEMLKVFEDENLVSFVLPTSSDMRLYRYSYDTGEFISEDILYSFPNSTWSKVNPWINTDDLWYFDEATFYEESNVFRLFKINRSIPSVIRFDLQVPALTGYRFWQFEAPVFIGDTLVLYGYYDREFLDFENVPQAHFLAKYYLPQVSDLKNVHSLGQFQIAPNPASHQISLLNLPAEPLGVHVLDLQGRILYSGHSHRQSTIDLPVEQLSAGIYFVSVQGANGVRTQKFIKH